MISQRTVFSQIALFLPWYQFDKIVKEHKGDYRCRNFKCRDQLLIMLFAQLTYRDGLRSIEYSLNSQKSKLYHMGIRCGVVARNTIAKANEVRPYRIYEDLANQLLIKARTLYKDDKVLEGLDFDKSIYALDSSIIDISLSLAPWAKCSKVMGAVKFHALIDLKGNLPIFNIITNGKVYDGVALDIIPLEAGSIYVIDRGYIDYSRLYKIETNGSFFITRSHSKLKFKRIYSNKVTSSLSEDLIPTFRFLKFSIFQEPIFIKYLSIKDLIT